MSSCVAPPALGRLHRQGTAEHTGRAPAGLRALPEGGACQSGENTGRQPRKETRQNLDMDTKPADVNSRFLRVQGVGWS